MSTMFTRSGETGRIPAVSSRTLGIFSVALLIGASLHGCQRLDEAHSHGNPPPELQPEGESHDESEAGHPDEVTLSASAIESNGITIEPAKRCVLRPTFIAPARVGFNLDAIAHVGSTVSGRVVEMKVRLGDTVETHQDLLVIESAELGMAQAKYFQQVVEAQSAAPAVDVAKATWDRAKGLHTKSEGISLTEVQRREAEYKSAVASQRSAEAAVIGSENLLHLLGMDQEAVEALAVSGEITPRYHIRAPIDGQIVEREVTLGELVGPEHESLMIIADMGTLWLLADVPEARLQEVAVGVKAWFTLGAAGGPKHEGRVAFISPWVDRSTRTAQVRIEASSDRLALKPGMFARAEIMTTPSDGQDSPPIVAVPDEAIQIVEGLKSIFVPVMDEPNTFQRRSVSAGSPVDGMVPIYSGLVEGELVVISGTFILKAELGKSSAEHQH